MSDLLQASQQLHQAAKILVGACDGAARRDETGFNKFDAAFGRELAYKSAESWTVEMAHKAFVTLRKYRRQLAGTIDFEAIKLPAAGLKRVEVTNGEFAIIFPYDTAMLDKVRALPRRHFYDRILPKRWLVPAAQDTARAVYDFAQANGFTLTSEALELMESVDNEVEESAPVEQDPVKSVGISNIFDVAAKQPAAPVEKKVPAPKPVQPSIFNAKNDQEVRKLASSAVTGEVKLTKTKVVVTFTSIPDVMTRAWMKEVDKDWEYADTKWSFPRKIALKIAEYFPNHKGSAEIIAEARAEEERLAEIERKRLEEIRVTGEKLMTLYDPNEALRNGRTLYSHQKEDVKTLIEKLRQVVGSEMGTGKTIIALVAARLWQKAFNYPIIVIAPVNLRANWFKEAAMVGVRIEFYSWGKIPQSPSRNFVLIADEAHYAKNMQAKRTKDFLALAESEFCKGCYPMTGTPIENGRPAEFFPLLKAIRADIAKDKKFYEKRYCAGGMVDGRWDSTGASHMLELHEKLQPYMIRRLKKDCLDLPPKVRTTIKAELSKKAKEVFESEFKTRQDDYYRRLREAAEQKAIYEAQLLNKEIEQEEFEQLCNELMSEEGEQLVVVTHMRASGSVAKVDHATQLALEVLRNGNPVLIFTDFVPSAKLIAENLKDYRVEVLTGEVTGNDKEAGTTKRQAMVDRFQAGQSDVFISTFAAGGVGITLTRASDVILVDRPWKPGAAIQAEDRLHRIGQASTVNSIWLQCGKMDQKVDQALITKSENIDQVLEGKAPTSNLGRSFDRKFVKDLFEDMSNSLWEDEDSFEEPEE